MMRMIHPTDSMIRTAAAARAHAQHERRIDELRTMRARLVERSRPWPVRAWHVIVEWFND